MGDEHPEKPHGFGWYFAWILMALVLYVASIGPLTWYHFRGPGLPFWAERIADVVYAPIDWFLHSAPEPLTAPLWWYLDFCGWELNVTFESMKRPVP